MGKTRKSGECLQTLVKLALPLFKQSEKQDPRTGRGDKPKIPDWFLAVLIMIAIVKKKKRKSAQFRYLVEIQRLIAEWTGEKRFPARSTYFRRYRRAHKLYRAAVRLQGELAIKEGLVDPHDVAIDKSLLESLGEPWHKAEQRAGEIPAGVDTEAAWSYSEYHGWLYGYSYEVVVSATPSSVVFPLLASVNVASTSEMKSLSGEDRPVAGRCGACVARQGLRRERPGRAAGIQRGRHEERPALLVSGKSTTQQPAKEETVPRGQESGRKPPPSR